MQKLCREEGGQSVAPAEPSRSLLSEARLGLPRSRQQPPQSLLEVNAALNAWAVVAVAAGQIWDPPARWPVLV